MGTWDADLTGVVVLPCGRRVRGRALRGVLPEEEPLPEFGLYLTSKPHHEEGWQSHWICWPDFLLPRSSADALTALKDAYERSADVRVEIACDGGKGRTGTALAILARFAGVPAEETVAWVRANYRAGAIETPWQRRFARNADLGR